MGVTQGFQFSYINAHAHRLIRDFCLRQGGYVFIGVSLFVSRIRPIRKNYSTDFHNIRQNGAWHVGHGKKSLDFDGNSAYVMLGVRFR